LVFDNEFSNNDWIEHDYGTKTHHVDAIHRAQLERLILRVQYHVDHRAHLRAYDVVGRYESDWLLQPLLEGLLCSLQTRLNHVAWHELQALFKVLTELRVGPVQIANEWLKRVELPEEIFRGGAAISKAFQSERVLRVQSLWQDKKVSSK
jgi:hypothetical protein